MQPSGTAAVNPLPLHGFQKDAVGAAVREVKDGGRATVVAATGSGKTLIAAGCARRLAARGRVLVLVPTIELLEQTAEAWSLRGGRRGLAVAACSREEALESAEAGGRIHAEVTTQAARIADLVNGAPDGQPVTVYATYASLERIVQAHRDFGLPAWDLVVIDEAHRTAGAEGRRGPRSTTQGVLGSGHPRLRRRPGRHLRRHHPGPLLPESVAVRRGMGPRPQVRRARPPDRAHRRPVPRTAARHQRAATAAGVRGVLDALRSYATSEDPQAADLVLVRRHGTTPRRTDQGRALGAALHRILTRAEAGTAPGREWAGADRPDRDRVFAH
nr:hypothetical protein KitaXyl93_76060 [Kitasatospora sp. Xyl93]